MRPAAKRDIHIKVPLLARVEGEGSMEIHVLDGRIAELKLRIFEPPRLFEKFLEGRDYFEVPDMVARICGICPVAYQSCAVQAIEGLFGIEPTPGVMRLRRAIYCGEWIESHALHIHLLALPDFLGFESAPEMAKVYPQEVRRGLRLQGLGNDLIRLLGGRSVHPVGLRVGGLSRAPEQADIAAMVERLKAALPDAEALIAWTATLPLPQVEQDFISVSLRHPEDYPILEGRIISSSGLDIPIGAFEEHFEERQVPHSTALHCLLHGRPYLVGPLARLNLNLDRLPESTRRALEATGIPFPSRNMYHSVVARAVEIHYAFIEAIRLLEGYRPESPWQPVTPKAGIGYGCTEAPRGILWHRYQVDEQGHILHARIVPPTSQNQARIEEDLRLSLEALGLDKADEELRKEGETVIRNYDPCISCATHFLKLTVHR